MATKSNDKPHGTKWFLNQKVGSYDEGVYYASEVREMPEKVRQHIQSLSSAIRDGLIDGDLASAGDLSEIDLYGPYIEGGESNKKLRGVKEGHFKDYTAPSQPEKVIKPKSSLTKIGNKLRDKLESTSKNSEENSIKAQIAAKKAQLHPSDSGH